MRETPEVPSIPKRATKKQLLRQQELQKREHSKSVYTGRGKLRTLPTETINSHEQAIAIIRTAKELIHFLEHSPLFFGNAHAGLDHSEHIIKRIELSLKLRCSRLAPEQLGVRGKVASFMKGWKRKDRPTVKNEEYQHYLQKKYPDLHFSQRELDRISQKIPVDIFGSLDERIERVILLLNSFEGMETRFSCAGHNDTGSGYRKIYISFSTHDKKIVDTIGSFISTYKDKNIQIDFEDESDGKYRIAYTIEQPPSKWIQKHKLRTAEQMFADGKERVARIIGKPITIEVKDGKNFLEKLSSIIIGHIRTIGEEKKDEIESLEKLLPSVEAETEWREYFLSREAKARGDSFLNALEVTLQPLREKGDH